MLHFRNMQSEITYVLFGCVAKEFHLMDKKNSSYEAFIADLPPERTHEFRSPEELEAALAAEGVVQPTRQLSEGEFRPDRAPRPDHYRIPRVGSGIYCPAQYAGVG